MILFEADSAVGHAIDWATCGYGYSDAGLMCGREIINATGEGVVSQPADEVLERDHAIVRLNLTETQVGDLCQCVRDQIGEDCDHIEAATFGTLNDPGRELCTMLIMHCLDRTGVDRGELGLAGFVAPNDVARTLADVAEPFPPHFAARW
jgi:hypothetical protein